jgi:hypothetical protein
VSNEVSLGFVTYVRVLEGSTHPPGIYLNAEQLANDLDFLGYHAAASRVLEWQRLSFGSEDTVEVTGV